MLAEVGKSRWAKMAFQAGKVDVWADGRDTQNVPARRVGKCMNGWFGRLFMCANNSPAQTKP